MRVFGTVNGVAFRSSTMPYRGGFYLGLHKATREAAGVGFGDPLEIEITRDDSPRVLALPAELEAAFADEPARPVFHFIATSSVLSFREFSGTFSKKKDELIHECSLKINRPRFNSRPSDSFLPISVPRPTSPIRLRPALC